jgi:hypothetical protein
VHAPCAVCGRTHAEVWFDYIPCGRRMYLRPAVAWKFVLRCGPHKWLLRLVKPDTGTVDVCGPCIDRVMAARHA